MASVSISCPSCSATDGVVRNGKSTAGHQRYLCSHCRKTWQLQFTYTASQPGTHQKIIDMAMNGVGCRATYAVWGYSFNSENLDSRNKLHPDERNPESYEEAVGQMTDELIGRLEWLDENIEVLKQYCHESAVKKFNH